MCTCPVCTANGTTLEGEVISQVGGQSNLGDDGACPVNRASMGSFSCASTLTQICSLS